MHAGKKIKLLRNFQGMSQEELATKIRRTRGLVSYIETTGKVNHETLALILDVFKLNRDEFNAFEQSQSVPAQIKEYNRRSDEVKALQEQVKYYRNENATLHQLVESKQMIIEMLQQQKKQS